MLFRALPAATGLRPVKLGLLCQLCCDQKVAGGLKHLYPVDVGCRSVGLGLKLLFQVVVGCRSFVVLLWEVWCVSCYPSAYVTRLMCCFNRNQALLAICVLLLLPTGLLND